MDIKTLTTTINSLFQAINDPGNNIKAIKQVLVNVKKKEVKKILQSYGKVPTSSTKLTPLQYAVFTGQSNAVKYLLDKYSLDVNQTADYDPEFSLSYRNFIHTPFGIATLFNKSILAKLLCNQYGASIHTTPDAAPNALHIACNNGNIQLARFLIDRGCKIYIGYPDEGIVERPGYMIAVQNGYEYIVDYFLEKNVPINEGDRLGHTALHLVAKEGNISMAKLLLEKDAEFTTDKFGMTPLQIACLHLKEEMVMFMLEYLKSLEQLSQELKAETYELLGASLGIYSGYKYLCEAWTIRHSVDYIVEQKQVKNPQKCYDMQQEHITLKQLGEIYREEVQCLTKHNKCHMYNERQEQETLIIKERILGQKNPYIALAFDRIMIHNLHTGNSPRYLTFLVKQLELLHELKLEKSLVSLWVEISLYLIKLPKMTSNITFLTQLEKITRTCAEAFIPNNIWIQYDIKDWKKDLTSATNISDTAIERTVTAFMYVLFLVPFEDDKWLEAKPILSAFGHLCNKSLSSGKCTKSPFHVLVTADIWKNFQPEVIIEIVSTFIKLLVKLGLNVNVRDHNGNTPLHLVALQEPQWYTIQLIKILKQQHKAHLDIKNLDNQTPYQLYQSVTYEEIEPPKILKGKRTKSRAATERSKSRATVVSDTGRGNKSQATTTTRDRTNSRVISRLSVTSEVGDTARSKSRASPEIVEELRVRNKELAIALKPGFMSLQCACAHVIRTYKVKFKGKLNKKLRTHVLIH